MTMIDEKSPSAGSFVYDEEYLDVATPQTTAVHETGDNLQTPLTPRSFKSNLSGQSRSKSKSMRSTIRSLFSLPGKRNDSVSKSSSESAKLIQIHSFLKQSGFLKLQRPDIDIDLNANQIAGRAADAKPKHSALFDFASAPDVETRPPTISQVFKLPASHLRASTVGMGNAMETIEEQ